ncbi:serine/threonine-protein kinase [Fodinicola acaciae]|uniref:serine/threonine-protein kinase n=1 Tax=Fodinicola acaciae TaxID=2681555 RepID=UPI0013D21342|nr:serine/threonine-protein kinase [Fodinicola acaciae]
MTACAREGCGGTIEDDGFCDSCGFEAKAEAVSTRTATAAWTPTSSTEAWTPSTSTVGTVSTGSTGTSSGRRGSGRTSSRGLLGAGMVEVPRVPARDPATAILPDPKVPESKRYCSRCGAKVGRGKDDTPGREEGFCPECGNHFSFTPKLSAGDLVHGQYEVLGCLAHGGLGWIYLARDHAVADRWVVLKGLLDSGDADALAAALAERQFLAEVEHPSIVKIYNFVEHQHPGEDRAVGYIVMEYVGGTSIKDLIKAARTAGDPAACLPVEQAIAYALEMLPALGFLHGNGLLFCDFKPDNMIQQEEQLKLIDLGAVRQETDHRTSIYGTIGYQAPEIGEAWPSVSSDLYTVGRSLAVMSFAFDFQIAFRHKLPSAADVPLLADYPSFHQFLLRATAKDPAARFTDAEQMREQLTGVLREVLASQDGQPRPGTSTEFTPEKRAFGASSRIPRDKPDPAEVATVLPVPLVDPHDPGTTYLASVTAADATELIEALSTADVDGLEVRLRLVRAHLDVRDATGAGNVLDGLDGADWRIDWYRGLVALAAGRPDDAVKLFTGIYHLLPGEAAPKLALAVAAETAGDTRAAERFYRVVWRTDRGYISAAFGLARALLAAGERTEAVAVLGSVPDVSSHHVAAMLAAVRTRIGLSEPDELAEADLLAAGDQVAALDLEVERRTQVTRELLEVALAWRQADPDRTATGSLLGCRLAEPDLRLALEDCFRTLARRANSRQERFALVDRANQIRPRTWT